MILSDVYQKIGLPCPRRTQKAQEVRQAVSPILRAATMPLKCLPACAAMWTQEGLAPSLGVQGTELRPAVF